jgi:hypothetical protein
MEIIDFTKAREKRLEKVALTKKEPHARYKAIPYLRDCCQSV